MDSSITLFHGEGLPISFLENFMDSCITLFHGFFMSSRHAADPMALFFVFLWLFLLWSKNQRINFFDGLRIDSSSYLRQKNQRINFFWLLGFGPRIKESIFWMVSELIPQATFGKRIKESKNQFFLGSSGLGSCGLWPQQSRPEEPKKN